MELMLNYKDVLGTLWKHNKLYTTIYSLLRFDINKLVQSLSVCLF